MSLWILWFNKECSCSNQAINKYLGKISGPLLDRIDIQVEVSSVKYKNLNSNTQEETSEQIRKRVEETRKFNLKDIKNAEFIRTQS